MRKKLFAVFLVLLFAFLFWEIKKAMTSLWDGRSRISFVLALESTLMVSLEPGKDLTIFVLPDNLYLEVPHGLGQYQLGSVYKLGELEGRGGELLGETVQNYFAIPIDGWGNLPNYPTTQLSHSLLLLCQGRGKTNFSRWDLLRLWWEIKKLRSDKIRLVKLKEIGILSQAYLPDGSLVWETELFRLDDLVKNYCIDHKVYEEALSLEVLNATDHLGLASSLSRMMTNMGGKVVAVGNAKTKIPNSKFQIPNEKLRKSYTVQKLEKILGVKAKVGEMGESRADLLILLGEDYWES